LDFKQRTPSRMEEPHISSSSSSDLGAYGDGTVGVRWERRRPSAIGDIFGPRKAGEGQRTQAPSRRGPLLPAADEDDHKNAAQGRTHPHIQFMFQNPRFSYKSMLLFIGIEYTFRVLWDSVDLGFRIHS